MKYLFLFLFMIILFSNCSTKNSKNEPAPDFFIGNTPHQIDSGKTYLTYQILIGTWMNCSVTWNNTTITANVCKKIRFQRDGTATVIFPSGEQELMNWSISNNVLMITLVGDSGKFSQRMLSDRIYETILTIDKVGYDLTLKAKNKDYSYSLGKSFND